MPGTGAPEQGDAAGPGTPGTDRLGAPPARDGSPSRRATREVPPETHRALRCAIRADAESALDEPAPCYVWNLTQGLRRAGEPIGEPSKEGDSLAGALAHAARGREPGVYLIQDAHPFLQDPLVRRALRDCFQHSRQVARTVVLTGSRAVRAAPAVPPSRRSELLPKLGS